MTIKEKATRLCAMIGICLPGIYLAACDNGELPAGGEGAAKVELRFSASISDSPSTKGGQPPQPTITQGTAFSEGQSHLFGMFVTHEDGTALSEGSGDNDNMKSTLTVSGTTQRWAHTDKTGTTPISLAVNNGENIIIKGYYPWTAGATATAVPFDLSSTDPTEWTDLLYLSSPTGQQPITDGMGPISLKFSHAFCWVTINLLQLSSNNTVKVKAVNIGNAYAGQGTIVYKGTLNLKTGQIVNSVSGPLKIDLGSPIDLDTEGTPGASAAVFNFLVPPVMSSDIKNSDIVIDVTTLESTGAGTPDVEKVLTFPLSLTHLNQDNSSGTALYGFQKGKHNTYNIVYNNSAMNLSLSGWQTATIDEAKLGEGTESEKYKTRTFNASDKTVLGFGNTATNLYLLSLGNHIYHTYLGEVAENNNGKYVTEPSGNDKYQQWKSVMLSEPIYQSIYIAGNLAAGGAQIPWKDKETGALLAKQACVEFRDGGFSDWRLPRIGECFMMDYQATALEGKESWSATEANLTASYAVVKNGSSTYYPKSYSKQELFYVRCVRDADKNKPTK
ncbi:hypothetical protein [Parabacteroides gordonii]|uniref:hypothetical protein n=1 Tax=Parabacteroides gordonii TaxID=574930 RepID=UPI003A86EA1F